MQPPSRQVVVVGVGQVVQRDAEPALALEPVALMAEAAKRAERDAGAILLAGLDHVVGLHVLGWRYDSVATLLADRIGAAQARPIDTEVGGDSPQRCINELARRIRDGHCMAALVAGAEAIRTRRTARRDGVELGWVRGGPAPGRNHERWGDRRPGVSPREQRHGIVLPTVAYPLYETALRARLGHSPEDHQARIGALYARLSQVAADNPHAWFPKVRSADEICTTSDTNRIIAWPYPKVVNAVMEVDQGAAVILTSAEHARALGVPDDRMVHLLGEGEATAEPWFFSERPRMDESPAQRASIDAALASAGLSAEDVDAFDLYSCFPVAIELAMEALSIAHDDPRPVSVTGGLAQAGGPGNAYCLHAVARMTERLREQGGTGMVTGLGWYFTKHAAGLYGREPGDAKPRAPAPPPRQPDPEMTDTPQGPATVIAYTVVHDREGAPAQGIVIGRDARGRRFVANTPDDRELFEAMERREFVGASGVLGPDGERIVFTPA